MSGLNRASLIGLLLATGALAPMPPSHTVGPARGSRQKYGGQSYGKKTTPPRGQTHDRVTGVRLTVKYPANGHQP